MFRQSPIENLSSAGFFVFLPLICLLAGSSCQPSVAGKEQKGTNDPAVVWSISTKSGKKLILAGSLHLLGPEDHPLPQVLMDSLNRCRVLITETGRAEEARDELKAFVVSRGELSAGERLSEAVTDEVREGLARHYEVVPEARDQLEPLRPWLAALRIGAWRYGTMGVQRSLGVDATLLKLAEKRGMQIGSMESPVDQLGVLADLPWEGEEKLLKEVLEKASEQAFVASFGKLKEAWRSGDLVRLDRHLKETQQGSDRGLEGMLLGERNRRFAEHIRELGEASSEDVEDTMVLVGAGHLVGAAGIVATLRDEMGMELVRVSPGDAVGMPATER